MYAQLFSTKGTTSFDISTLRGLDRTRRRRDDQPGTGTMGRIGLTEIVLVAVLAFVFIQGLRDVEAEVTKGFSGPSDARTAPRDPEGQGQEPCG